MEREKRMNALITASILILLLAGCSSQEVLGDTDIDISEADASKVDTDRDLASKGDTSKDVSAEGSKKDIRTVDGGPSEDVSLKDIAEDLSMTDMKDMAIAPLKCQRDQPPILNGAEDRSIIANGLTNAGSYSGKYEDLQSTPGTPHPWPNFGDQIRMSLTANQYISAEFRSANVVQTGKLVFNPPGFNEGASATNVTVSVSECPGDFSVHLSKPKCLLIGVPADTFRWSSDPNANEGRYCKIEKNKTYYLNIVNSRDEAGGFGQTSCRTPYCGLLAIQIVDR